MHLIDWLIVLCPLTLVVFIGFKTQKYVKGVADFLTAGRVAGRYVLCVASAEAGMGLISLVAMYESYYHSGFAYGFWGGFVAPLMMILGLTGYCIYRFRETRAMTMGQFLEMRYSRNFRIFAGILQSISGIINYALFPAVGARFLVYFCGLPLNVEIFGMAFPTFAIIMAIFLGVAVFIATMGGQITIMTTDCIQGILSYPMYLLIVAYIVTRFSWFQDIAPPLMDRPSGKSLINPYDIYNLTDFNLFYVIVGVVGGIINRMGWSGSQGYNAAAKDAHEQKIGGVLGTWRAGFSTMMYILLAVVAFAYLNGEHFNKGKEGSIKCREELAVNTVNEFFPSDKYALPRTEAINYIRTGKKTPVFEAMLAKAKKLDDAAKAAREKIRYKTMENQTEAEKQQSEKDKEIEACFAARKERFMTAKDALRSVDQSAASTCKTIFGQMRVPMALKYILPVGLMGVFCALCVFLLISTDTTYLHSWGSILVQDVILPIHGRPFTPRQQLKLLRLLIAGVAVFAFFFSYFFGQVDYILMFFAITGAIWLGGSGPCIVGGLYWKRGTTAGAWCALISGSSLAVGAIFAQKYWASHIYPCLYDINMVDTVASWLQNMSAPFEPLIKWRMDSEKLPINSQELYAISMVISISLYVIVSLLTCKQPFNMDRMLHRGNYHREGIKLEKMVWRPKVVLQRLLGIDNQYTCSDKILAWSVFIWSFGWCFVCSFCGLIIWNLISPWSDYAWSVWFFINNFVIASVIGVVSTVWFTWGGTRDLIRMFKALAAKEDNVLDDGRVIGHVSADDVELVEKIDHIAMPQAHVEEEILRKELQEEGDTEDIKSLDEHTNE